MQQHITNKLFTQLFQAGKLLLKGSNSERIKKWQPEKHEVLVHPSGKLLQLCMTAFPVLPKACWELPKEDKYPTTRELLLHQS